MWERIETFPPFTKIYTLSIFVRWYDLWIGVFIDRKGHTVYICPVPCIGLKIRWRNPGEPRP